MIETKTEDYKSHKHEYNVYVKINSKTKLGQDLLDQYHEQAKKHYMDIGRIGYHDKYGRYIIDNYSLFELIAIPKLIISVTEKAIDKAGRDEYRLRTYMSKFGQLNFLLLVDRNCAELILVENVYIENLNHRENYETTIYKLRYSHSHPVPLREIFFKFGIRANPDDYGKAFKQEEASINNLIVAKAKAEMTILLANKLASGINQKALITSLNFLNKEGTYGKNVTSEYSKNVAKSKELNELSASPKLENTLNNVLVKTLEQHTTKNDVKDKTNFRIYKKVLDVELSSHSEVKKEVNKLNNKQNLKEFLLDTYQKHSTSKDDEEKINEKKFKTFEKIIEKQYSAKPNKEQAKPIEEDFKPKKIEHKLEDFFDFDNKKIDIDFNVSRFNAKEDANKKQINKQLEKLEKKKEKKQEKLFKAQNKNAKILNAECDLDKEFERSKITLGILPTDSKRKKKKAFKLLFEEDKKQANSNEIINNEEQDNKIGILEKIEKQIRSQKINKKQNKKTKTKKSKKANLLKPQNLENNQITNLEEINMPKQTKKQNINIKFNNPELEENNINMQTNLEQKNDIDKHSAKKQKGLLAKKVNNKKGLKSKNKTNQLDLNNLKEELISKIKPKKNKKTNADTLLFDDEKPKQKTDILKQNTNTEAKPKQKLNVAEPTKKTNQSSMNTAKTVETIKKQPDEVQQAETDFNLKQAVINDIKEKKNKKLMQHNLFDDIDKEAEKGTKTIKSEEITNNFNQNNKTMNYNNFDAPKKKPTKEIEREM